MYSKSTEDYNIHSPESKPRCFRQCASAVPWWQSWPKVHTVCVLSQGSVKSHDIRNTSDSPYIGFELV